MLYSCVLLCLHYNIMTIVMFKGQIYCLNYSKIGHLILCIFYIHNNIASIYIVTHVPTPGPVLIVCFYMETNTDLVPINV